MDLPTGLFLVQSTFLLLLLNYALAIIVKSMFLSVETDISALWFIAIRWCCEMR